MNEFSINKISRVIYLSIGFLLGFYLLTRRADLVTVHEHFFFYDRSR